jgi:hypothetical protein
MNRIKQFAILIFVLIVAPLSVHGQGYVHRDIVLNTTGTPLPGVNVRVCTEPASGTPCTPLASIYSDPGLSTPMANPFTADSLGNYQYYAAPGTYHEQLSGTGITGTRDIPNVSITAPVTPVVVNVNSLVTKTIAAALAACGTGPCVVDSRGHSEVLAATVTFPSFPVTLMLGPYTYTGPASGPAFAISAAAANGSSIVGSGMTGPGQGDEGNGTTIKAANGNTTPVLQFLSGAGGHFVNGIEVRNLNIDGNSVATSCLQLDSVRFSTFRRISMQNCTAYGLHTYSATATSDYGTQWNVFDQIYLANVGQCAYLDGNAAATSDTTQNHFENWQCNFSSTTAPGLQLHQADGNQFTNIKIFATNGTGVSSASNCVQLDSPVGGSVVGGLVNRFFGLHTSCLTPGHSVRAMPGTYGNRIYGYDMVEGQPGPYDTGSIMWEGRNNIGWDFFTLSPQQALGWGDGLFDGAPDVVLRRCDVNQLRLGTSATDCDANGSMIGHYFRADFWDTSATGVFTQNGVTVIDVNKQGIFPGGLGSVVYSANGTPKASVHFVADFVQLGGGGTATATLVGAAAFTNNGSYQCNTTDVSDATKTSTYSSVSGSSITFTGTATDFIRYVCVGN